jgi:hypothetical protein
LSALSEKSRRDRSVFINCPFDQGFEPLFNAMVFAVTFCGFFVRCGYERVDAGESRLHKICDLLQQSRLSIHDISMQTLDDQTGLPRFNMPLELGIALGMKILGRSLLRNHMVLVLDTQPRRYRDSASDLAGFDIAHHGNDQLLAIAAVRDFLMPHCDNGLPGPRVIFAAHEIFQAELPNLAAAMRLDIAELRFSDRIKLLQAFISRVDTIS